MTFLFVVAFDISDDRRRDHAVKALKNYIHRVQYSVFEGFLTMVQFNRMRAAVQGVIDLSADRVRFYRLCGACRDKVWADGAGAGALEEPVFFIDRPGEHYQKFGKSNRRRAQAKIL